MPTRGGKAHYLPLRGFKGFQEGKTAVEPVILLSLCTLWILAAPKLKEQKWTWRIHLKARKLFSPLTQQGTELKLASSKPLLQFRLFFQIADCFSNAPPRSYNTERVLCPAQQRRAQQQGILKSRLGSKESRRERQVKPGLKESKLLGEKRGLAGDRETSPVPFWTGSQVQILFNQNRRKIKSKRKWRTAIITWV